MASISGLFGFRHLRSEPSSHILFFRKGKLVRSGRGRAFWFHPLSASIAEIPCDDRDESFLFHARTSDFQDVTAQGVITYRVANPEVVAERIDFSINVSSGRYTGKPLEHVSQLLVQSAQQLAWAYLSRVNLKTALAEGVDQIRQRIAKGLVANGALESMGLQIVSVRVASVAPTAELERALQAPTQEAIQQTADEAVFQRRALAVEKERAIAENELSNKIELAKREEELIAQQGQNARKRADDKIQVAEVLEQSKADRRRVDARARADASEMVTTVEVKAEQERMAIYRDLPAHVLLGLAAQELARKLERIEHLNISPEMLGPLLGNLLQAGTQRLNSEAASS